MEGLELGMVVREQLGSQQLGIQPMEAGRLDAIAYSATAGQRRWRCNGLVARASIYLQCTDGRRQRRTMDIPPAAGASAAASYFISGACSTSRS